VGEAHGRAEPSYRNHHFFSRRARKSRHQK
jgi:hypothetical protein